MIGHSVGAPVAAGALTIEDGAAVACRHVRLIRERAVPGATWTGRAGEHGTMVTAAGGGGRAAGPGEGTGGASVTRPAKEVP